MNPSDERNVTAQNNPGSGAVTNPAAQGTTDRVSAPASEKNANPNSALADKTLRQTQPSNAVNPDFDFEQGDPAMANREAPANLEQSMDMGQQNPQGQSPIQVMFKGEAREYSPESAQAMLQQYLNMQETQPAVATAKRIAEQRGITDPMQLAQFMEQALTGQGAGADAVSAEQRLAETENTTKPAYVMDAKPLDRADVEAQVNEFFENNGLTPTDAVRDAFINVMQNGQVYQQVGQNFNNLAQDVTDVKKYYEAQAMEQHQARMAEVGDTAAKEAGIEDTPENVQAFVEFVQQQNATFPGFQENIGTNPDAMRQAIHQFAQIRKAQQLQQQQAQFQQGVQADAARAGGEGVASRGTDGPGPAARQGDFNSEMMDTL